MAWHGGEGGGELRHDALHGLQIQCGAHDQEHQAQGEPHVHDVQKGHLPWPAQGLDEEEDGQDEVHEDGLHGRVVRGEHDGQGEQGPAYQQGHAVPPTVQSCATGYLAREIYSIY